jgi:hypothetical protein
MAPFSRREERARLCASRRHPRRVQRHAVTGSGVQLVGTSLSPITPARISAMHSILGSDAESPSTAMPMMAVPAAPIPVQTAYPVPTGKVRSAAERRTTLDSPVATVRRPGVNRVKPSDAFMKKANAISRTPAIQSSAQAIFFDPLFVLITRCRADGKRAARKDDAVPLASSHAPFVQALATAVGTERNEMPKRLKAFVRPIA